MCLKALKCHVMQYLNSWSSHKTVTCLLLVFSARCVQAFGGGVMERQLAGQLPGGKLHDPSPDLLTQSQSCRATNISAKQVFGKVDAARKRAPNTSVHKVKSKLMFSCNQTSQWLSSHPLSERRTTWSTVIANKEQSSTQRTGGTCQHSLPHQGG